MQRVPNISQPCVHFHVSRILVNDLLHLLDSCVCTSTFPLNKPVFLVVVLLLVCFYPLMLFPPSQYYGFTIINAHTLRFLVLPAQPGQCNLQKGFKTEGSDIPDSRFSYSLGENPMERSS